MLVDTSISNGKKQTNVIVPIEQLITSLKLLLIKAGLEDTAALVTAEVLVEGDIKGYPSHGIERIFQILDGVSKGTINLKAKPVLVKSSSSIAVIDGKFGLGQPIAKEAMQLAISKAHESGIGAVGVINSGHIGILSYFSEIASANDCMGLVMSTSSPAVVIAGGREKTFGTNPISYSFPTSTVPITADFSTSKVSRSAILECLAKNEPIPAGWAVNTTGHTTNVPSEALTGGINTIDSGIKGSLISMLVSVLAGHLIGGVINPLVTGTRYMEKKPNKGDFFMALSLAHFTDSTIFKEQSEHLIQFIIQQEVDFRIPGSRSIFNKNNKKIIGIEISDKIIDLFKQYQVNI